MADQNATPSLHLRVMESGAEEAADNLERLARSADKAEIAETSLAIASAKVSASQKDMSASASAASSGVKAFTSSIEQTERLTAKTTEGLSAAAAAFSRVSNEARKQTIPQLENSHIGAARAPTGAVARQPVAQTFYVKELGLDESIRRLRELTSESGNTAIAFDKLDKTQISAARGLNSLARAGDPTLKVMQDLERDTIKVVRAIEQGLGGTREMNAAIRGLEKRYNDLNKSANDNEKGVALGRHELINLGRQAQDIAVSLAGGQSPLMVLAQQGSQVYDVLATSKGGVGNALKSLGEILLGLVTPGRVAMVGLLGGLSAVELAASRAQSALADLGRVSSQTGFSPTSIMGAQVIGARAGLDEKAVVSTLGNAAGQFETYKKNTGDVLEFIKSVDKGFLKVLDTSRNTGEWIDKIGQEIRKLPLAEARDLAEKAFGGESARALFDTIREGKFNMEAFAAAAGSAAAPIDDAARKAADMQKQIDAAATKAGNDLLVAFQSLGSPVESIKLGWYETVSHISRAITESQNLQTAFWALLHPLDAVSLAVSKLNAGLADKISEILGETKKAAADVHRGSLFIEMSGGAPRNPRAQGRSISQIESDLKLNKRNTPDIVPEAEFNRARDMMLLGGNFRVGEPAGNARARYDARKEAESAAKKSGKSDVEKDQEKYEKILKDIEQQVRLVEAVGAAHKDVQWQIEKENWLSKLGNDNRADHKKKIEEAAEALRKVREEQEKLNEKVREFNEAYSSAAGIVSGGIKDILHGGKPGDALKKGLDAFGDNVLDAALTGSGPLAKMFGMDNKTGGVGGLFGGVASMFGLGGKDVQTHTMKVNAANVEVVGAAGMLDGAKGLFSGIGDSAGGFFSKIGGFFKDVFNFADGGVMTSAGPIPLRRYASGGVANSPQLALFGEGRGPEAFVPLPDGRSIPVSMKGGGEPKISIHNYAGVQVEARKNAAGEIEVLIDRKIAANNARLPGMLSDYDRRRA